jgi:hypothetical protein
MSGSGGDGTALTRSTRRGGPVPDEEAIAVDTDDVDENATARTVLDPLIDHRWQRPWTLHEIGLAINNHGVAEDALDELVKCGLIHKTCDGFIFASRAAIGYTEIYES